VKSLVFRQKVTEKAASRARSRFSVLERRSGDPRKGFRAVVSDFEQRIALFFDCSSSMALIISDNKANQ
jgi:hypothetical protein